MSRPKIERLFFNKRKRGMMFSPKEWMVVDKWLNDGIPFDVIEKGINQTFHKCKTPLFKVNIYQCDAEIQRLWLWHKQNRKTRPATVIVENDNKAFIAEQLDRIEEYLGQKQDLSDKFTEFYGRMLEALVKIKKDIQLCANVDTFTIDNQVEKVFNDGWILIRSALESEVIDKAKAALEEELKNMKQNMTIKAYQETIEAALEDELQELVGFEKLNLFSLKL